ncbi:MULTISPECIES: NCS2 family permease [Psychrilyobacter]|uniref:NCS2 family permease n=1 Tax=Psychrilyobacter piezotolerans TaxID=2293438 RepID=A0ABX9KJS3_9FUSO|nr:MULTISPECIES: NCS2 family permease [Psychrilyobacter]MCS5422805.1 NCS2 family permease [Psychrilyobacter sp. S5]NDI76853.1 NCS2 family permease [Psychrilyobacter piezotolerans]RDE65132.1 NCS2 family permease [Psychrilyobacter sp. S5]REI42702.1 NCS2 family permease [Psychrilyobacter piezotolerans]
MLERMFKLTERETSVKQEVIGGLTTFMTMSYIIFVNPSIMADTGMDKGALITITCLSAAIGSLIAAFWANAPLGLAPGMGLNAFFTYTLVIGKGIPWETALGVVFISGLFFLVMSIGGIRERIAQAIPVELKIASTAGIGLFIAFIGLKSMGLIVANPATFVSLGKFTPTVVLGVIGIMVSALLELRGIKGGMLIGMITTTVLGMIVGVVDLPTHIISMPPSIAPIAFKLDIVGAFKFALIGPIFSFMFVDLFDSLGTLIACAKEMGMEDEDGNILSLGRMIHTDVASTIVGSLLGSSTVTTLSETTAGIAAGARTGLASVVIGILFLLSLLFTPIVGIVPAYATAPALIIVGIYMFKNLKELDLHDFKTALPVFATVIMMPLTYSISTGLSFGFLSFIVVHVGTGEHNKVSPVLWAIGGLSLLSLVV